MYPVIPETLLAGAIETLIGLGVMLAAMLGMLLRRA